VTLAPWEYLFLAFNSGNFPDLFDPIWVSSLVFLVATVALYVIRTRQLHRHQPYLDLYEWLLWTGVIFFSLVLVYAVFHFDFIIVIISLPVGLGLLVWIRFIRFPPQLRTYEAQLAKQRYLSKFRYAHPDATIKQSKRSAKRSQSRRRR
jgi:hypothetical protein